MKNRTGSYSGVWTAGYLGRWRARWDLEAPLREAND
jgi:hypothetical protein